MNSLLFIPIRLECAGWSFIIPCQKESTIGWSTLCFYRPGKYPCDVIDKESITLVNMKAEVADYTWDDKLDLEMPEPRGANMSFVNLKSVYKPFIIFLQIRLKR